MIKQPTISDRKPPDGIVVTPQPGPIPPAPVPDPLPPSKPLAGGVQR